MWGSLERGRRCRTCGSAKECVEARAEIGARVGDGASTGTGHLPRAGRGDSFSAASPASFAFALGVIMSRHLSVGCLVALLTVVPATGAQSASRVDGKAPASGSSTTGRARTCARGAKHAAAGGRGVVASCAGALRRFAQGARHRERGARVGVAIHRRPVPEGRAHAGGERRLVPACAVRGGGTTGGERDARAAGREERGLRLRLLATCASRRAPPPARWMRRWCLLATGCRFRRPASTNSRGSTVRGKIVVYVNSVPKGLSAALQAHGSRSRWVAMQRGGAVGAIALGTGDQWNPSAPLGVTVSLADVALDDAAGQRIFAAASPALAARLLAGSEIAWDSVRAMAGTRRGAPDGKV